MCTYQAPTRHTLLAVEKHDYEMTTMLLHFAWNTLMITTITEDGTAYSSGMILQYFVE